MRNVEAFTHIRNEIASGNLASDRKAAPFERSCSRPAPPTSWALWEAANSRK